MKEQLISFETAKLAKEKGFDLCVNRYYYQYKIENHNDVKHKLSDNIMPLENYNYQYDRLIKYSAPTQSLLQKWFREKYGINIEIRTYAFGYWVCHHNTPKETIDRRWNVKNELGLGFDTYEQALEKGLQEALKLI